MLVEAIRYSSEIYELTGISELIDSKNVFKKFPKRTYVFKHDKKVSNLRSYNIIES